VALGFAASLWETKARNDAPTIISAKHAVLRHKNTSAPLGPEHLDVAQSLNTLGRLYYKQGPYAKAETLLERALTIREKALGSEHPDVATTSTIWGASP
jgi:uncharacterized protein HemY